MGTAREKRQPPPELVPGESPGERSLAGHSPWGHTESDTSRAERAVWSRAGQLVPGGSSGRAQTPSEVGGEVGVGWWYEGPGVVGFEDTNVVCSGVTRI